MSRTTLSVASRFDFCLTMLSGNHDVKDWYKAFGFPPDTLRGAMAAVRKRQSLISSTATAACATSTVPRSTSQPGNCRETMSATVNCLVGFDKL